MFIDTHTHIYDSAFDSDRTDTMSRALNAGISMMILPNIDINSIHPMKVLHNAYPKNTRMAIGLHPTEVGDNWHEDLRVIASELADNNSDYVAIGEVGMDLYWDQTYTSQQMQAFDEQAHMAVENGVPLIIHCRNALSQTLEVLSGLQDKPLCIFHSFGGSKEDVDLIRSIVPDCVFGINGVVTFKNSGLRPVLPYIGLKHIVLETDSPYLAPTPYRGKRNESAYIPLIAKVVADALQTDIDTVAKTTSSTARRIFRL